jgi:hypothetical protein
MGILGGLDLGHGSQLKLIRTNFLCTEMTSTGANTSQALANFLTLANNRLPKLLKCDYILVVDSDSEVFPSIPTGQVAKTSQHSNVAFGFASASLPDHARDTNIALMGPSTASLAVKSAAGTHANSFTDVQSKASGKVLAVTSISAFKTSASNADAFFGTSSVEFEGGVNDEAHLDFINSTLLSRQLNGATGSVSIDLSKPIADIRSEGVSDVDYSATALNSGFVAEGNTGGLTPTTFTTLDSLVHNKSYVILSVTALVRDAQ